LVIALSNNREEKLAVLIENKIAAPQQPSQAERYAKRGQKGIEEGSWVAFKTMIVAPNQYLQARPEAAGYDVQLSYEAIRDWFANPDSDPRASYRRRIVQAAIDQAKRGYNPQADPRMTKFFHDYWDISSVEFPELGMPEPGQKPRGSDWIGFWPEHLKKKAYLWHKANLGRVDLEIPGAAGTVGYLHEQHGAHLGPDISIVKAGKSAALRMSVPPIDFAKDVDAQVNEVRAALKAAFLLLYQSHLIPLKPSVGGTTAGITTPG